MHPYILCQDGTRSSGAQNRVQRSARLPGAVLLARFDLSEWGQTLETTLASNPSLGWALITHPFHPLKGQRFAILKIRKVAGREVLVFTTSKEAVCLSPAIGPTKPFCLRTQA